MSANANVLHSTELLGSRVKETGAARTAVYCEANVWNAEDFAREQVRNLVRQVFFASGAPPIKQVVLSAADPRTDTADICNQVGRALALETGADVAIVGRDSQGEDGFYLRGEEKAAIKSRARKTAINLWHVPQLQLRDCGEEPGTGRYWLSCLARLRTEFEYAVIHGPTAGISSEAAVLGQLADGIILVLGAHSTRRATARKIKETLEAAHSRILGTILSERRFPVPEQIYRRL